MSRRSTPSTNDEKDTSTTSTTTTSSSNNELTKSGEKPTVMLAQQTDRWKQWWIRTYATIAMITGFAAIIYFGHLALALFVIALQIAGFTEVLRIRHQKLKMDRMVQNLYWGPYYIIMDIYLFFCMDYFTVGLVLFNRFPSFFLGRPYLAPLFTHHSLMSFTFLVIGIVAFVFTLKRGYYKMQFKQLAWTVVSLVAIAQSTLHINNIFEGLIWFLLPCCIIVCNDIAAYIWGFFFGRTPLIKLSPKKTWEGFIGAFFSTLVFAFVFSWFLAQFEYFICPKTDLFIHPVSCEPAASLTLTKYEFPVFVTERLAHMGITWNYVWLYPIQLHSLVLATFGSLIAPFAGFIASGFKRAFDIKDFGDLIPGHGGIVDRMDCQLIMGAFASLYHANFIRNWATVASVMDSIYPMTSEDQLAIFQQLGAILTEKGLM